MPLRTQLHSLSHLISCLSRMAANSRCICRSLSCFLHFNSTLVFSFLSPFFFSYSKENYVRENVNCNTNVCLFLLQKGKKWKSKKRGSWSCFFFYIWNTVRRDPTGEVLLHCLPCPGFPRFTSRVQENLSIYICPSEYLLQHPEAGDQLRPSPVCFPAKAWLELGFANHSDDWFTLDCIYFHSGPFSLYFSLFYHFHNHFC